MFTNAQGKNKGRNREANFGWIKRQLKKPGNGRHKSVRSAKRITTVKGKRQAGGRAEQRDEVKVRESI